MKPIEFICAQNWVDQAENLRRPCHPTLRANADENGWQMIDYTDWWGTSPQGWDVWETRLEEMRDVARHPFADKIELLR